MVLVLFAILWLILIGTIISLTSISKAMLPASNCHNELHLPHSQLWISCFYMMITGTDPRWGLWHKYSINKNCQLYIIDESSPHEPTDLGSRLLPPKNTNKPPSHFHFQLWVSIQWRSLWTSFFYRHGSCLCFTPLDFISWVGFFHLNRPKQLSQTEWTTRCLFIQLADNMLFVYPDREHHAVLSLRKQNDVFLSLPPSPNIFEFHLGARLSVPEHTIPFFTSAFSLGRQVRVSIYDSDCFFFSRVIVSIRLSASGCVKKFGF